MPRICIDGCCLGRKKTGNETYLRGVLSGLERCGLPAGWQCTVLTTAAHTGPRAELFHWEEVPQGNFLTRNFSVIPRRLRALEAELYHASYWTRWWDARPRKVVMIHDLSFVSFPQGFHRHEQIFYAEVVRRVARHADHVLTVSEYSKRDLMERWKIPCERITVTYDGLDACFVPKQADGGWDHDSSAANASPGLQHGGAPRPYILYVGNLHPRKNLVRLLEAFVLLKEQERVEQRLVIVGQAAWLAGEVFEAVRRHGLAGEVEFTGYLPREELVRRYQGAAVTVYPSLFEGFGLPVLEAMACGSPVVASQTTSIPEVAGEACVLVDPESAEDIARGIHRVLADGALAAELRRRGPAQAARFTWEACARGTLEAYRAVLGG